MTVSDILQRLIEGDLIRSLQIFLPEIMLSATVVGLLLLRLFDLDRIIAPSTIAFVGTLLCVFALGAQFIVTATAGGATTSMPSAIAEALTSVFQITPEGVGTTGAYFTGLLMHDAFTVFFRLGLATFLMLVIVLTILSGIPDDEDGPDFYTLLVGSAIGMMIATSANNLLMLFLGIEMMSVPSYVMVGFLKGRRLSSEASFKFVVFGAGTAGVMLYGISLLAGLLGTSDFAELGPRLAFLLSGQEVGIGNPNVVAALLGIMMVLVGIAFKLSLVPFHFWCPDAFEGAPAEVGGYLSVASKAASFALLVRFLLAFATGGESLQTLNLYLGLALGAIAAVSMTYGNLAAYTQTNVKRLLAYSTIAHAGYMLLAVSAMLVILNAQATAGWSYQRIYIETVRSIESLMYYLVVYLFMNLTAFAIVAFIRNQTFSEEIDSYNGLALQGGAMTLLCVCMGFALFSLIGIPPFGGFVGKLFVFNSVISAASIHWFMWVLLVVGGMNTAFSLYYYLKVLKAMFLKPAPEDARPSSVPGLTSAYVLVVAIPILLLGLVPPLMNNLSATANFVASSLFL
jgi:NADH-quinone oxidoreductase subunit N